MNPGAMRERIQLLRPDQSGSGWQNVTWTPVDTVWARVAPLSGRERTEQQATVTKIDYRVTMRDRDDITEAWRIGWNGAQLKIIAITNPDEHEAYLEIDCQRDRAE